MDFREAKVQVYSKIKRPDKESEAGDAINEAIAFAALRNFSADLVEVTHPITNTEYAHRLDLTNPTYFTRFRKIKYIRPTGYRKYLEFRDAAKVFQEGTECRDVWYRSGTGILISLSALQSTLEIGYYRYPATMTKNEDTHWMLDQMWLYVKDFAISRMYEAIGEPEESNRLYAKAIRTLEGYVTDLADGVSYG